MAALKDRSQNPVIGDTVRLKFFVFNSNLPAQVASINEVRIYYVDPNPPCPPCPPPPLPPCPLPPLPPLPPIPTPCPPGPPYPHIPHVPFPIPGPVYPPGPPTPPFPFPPELQGDAPTPCPVPPHHHHSHGFAPQLPLPCEPVPCEPMCPYSKVLVVTVPGSAVVNPCTGEYYIDLYLDPMIFTLPGRYIDEWDATFQVGGMPSNHDQLFKIYSELWFTSPTPVLYDFTFYFQPNKIRKGEKKPIQIELVANVPTATDLCAYYENLAISSQLYVYISQRCGECMPVESDLQLVVDRQPTFYREKNRAFYFIDTNQFDCGIYDVWFELEFGANTYVSDTNQLQIYS